MKSIASSPIFWGAGKLADEMFSWFNSGTMDECMDDIANTWDIDFSDEYGEQ